MNRKKYNSSKLIKRKKFIFHLKVYSGALLVILGITGFIYFSNSQVIQIDNLEIGETDFFDNSKIKDIAEERISKKFLGIIGMNNIIFLPRITLIQTIKKYHPAIKKVNLRFSSLKSLHIDIEEYEPVAVWCASSKNDKCYLLNEYGSIFTKVLNGFPNNLPRFINKKDDPLNQPDNDPLNMVYVDTEAFKKIISLINLLDKIDFHVTSVTTEDEMSFHLLTNYGVHLFYEKNDDPEEVANNLNAVLDKDAINKAQLKNIEYIDLRFGNKVYYKIR